MERGYIKITEEEIGKPIVEVKIVNGTVWMFKHEIGPSVRRISPDGRLQLPFHLQVRRTP